MKEYPLMVELIPKSSWFINLRSELLKKDWDRIRKACYKNANYRCQICGGRGVKWPVECHEIWEYESILIPGTVHKQKLVGLIALCPKCHQVKHIGRARAQGKLKQCIKHMARINNISEAIAERLIQEAFELYLKRSSVEWEVDISAVLK